MAAADQIQEFPPATFEFVLSTMATQAMIAMGQVPNPATGKQEVHRPFAKLQIDSIAMLEEKTEGNLTDAEQKALNETLSQLRMLFVATEKMH